MTKGLSDCPLESFGPNLLNEKRSRNSKRAVRNEPPVSFAIVLLDDHPPAGLALDERAVLDL